jgi:hypothetical protein
MRQRLLNYCQSRYGQDAKIGYSTPIIVRWCWQKVGQNPRQVADLNKEQKYAQIQNQF